MAKELSTAEQLREVVKETSGAAMTLSPNDEGWGGYLLQKKKKFEAPSFDELATQIISYIKENRAKAVAAEGKKEPKKPFKF